MAKKTSSIVEPDRSAFVTIGNRDYELILSTKATRLIAKRYGGLEHLGEQLQDSTDLGKSLTEVIWLIVLLANQSVQIYNLRNHDDPRSELSVDEVELLTVPADLPGYKGAITEALQRGTRRAITTEAPKTLAVTTPAKDG